MTKVIALLGVGGIEFEQAFEKMPDVDFTLTHDAAEFRSLSTTADVIMLMNTFYTEALARHLKESAMSLKLIAMLTAGYERLEQFGVPAGVKVTTAGDTRSPAVAEHAMALLLAMVKRLPAAFRNQQDSHWEIHFRHSLDGLSGKTLLIVGYGGIGREISRRAAAFGMKIIGVNRSGKSAGDGVDIVPIKELASALPRADVVILAVPSSSETRGLIGKDQLALMKTSAYLINVARGDVLDEAALIDALDASALAGAALDVTATEPLEKTSPLWGKPRLIVTSHVAGSDGEAGNRRLAALAVQNVAHLMAGEALEFEVSPRP